MNLRELEWFLAVAEIGSVTEAADQLHVSQPGLSRGLERLERELGVSLFERGGRSLRLSPAGSIFRPHATRLLAEAQAAREALVDAADPDRGEVRLAFLHTLGTWLIPDLISRYRAQRPGIRFSLSQDGLEAVVAAVREGRADLGFVSPHLRQRDLGWRRLALERLCLAVAPDHPLADRERVRVADIGDGPLITFRAGHGLRTITDRLCRRAGLHPRIAFEGEEVGTVRGLVAAGLGVAVLPPPLSPAADEALGVRHLALADTEARREIGAVWPLRRELPPPVEYFRRFVVGAGPERPEARTAGA